MRRVAVLLWAAILLSLPHAPVAAQGGNPTIGAQVGGIDDQKARRADVVIEEMDVAVRVHGGLAETVLTARLRNRGQEELEGRFTLQMPDGSIVTGYALDVEGAMVEGVLVDQPRARRAYERQVRREIDPGLAEVSRAFSFNTRVYPIGPGGTRTVRVRFVTPIDPVRGYELPIVQEMPVSRAVIAIEASGLAAAPRLTAPFGAAPAWTRTGDVWRAAWEGQGVRLGGSLALAPLERAAPMLIGRGAGGETWFEIADTAPAAPAPPPPTSVAILWDRSLSRGDDLLDRELALLEAWLSQARPQRIELLLFDAGGVERAVVADPGELLRRLRAVTYRGATSIEQIAAAAIAADACILFSDGLVTLGRRPPLRPACALSTISSAPDADRAWLRSVAAGAGGEALQLTASNGAELVERLLAPGVRVASVRTAGGEPVEAVFLDAPGGSWRLVGPLPSEGSVVVQLAGGAGERVYSAAAPPAAWSAAEGIWAADRLALRVAAEEESRPDLLAFARRHSVAAPGIAFLVLEQPGDYAQANIDPPAGYPAARRAEYDALARERREEEEEARRNHAAELMERWNLQKEWWAKRFDPRAKADRDEKEDDGDGPAPVVDLPLPAPPPSPDQATRLPGTTAADSADEAMGEADSIVVTGALRSIGPTSVVELPDWAPDRPYLKALRTASAADRERVLAGQQKEHGALPAFWLDVAEHYHRAGERREAQRLLLSALELPTRNEETLAVVAARLERWGEIGAAIRLYEKLAAADPDRPQPLRSLALALAKRASGAAPTQARADLGRAIALLADVAARPWPNYEGIDLIALMEANSLIPRYRAAGGTDVPLDPRLVALLDVDVRIVVEWNTEATDLDLWVIEPNGERAYYQNQATRIGGRMSNDMTAGYGPEEYLLRRAPSGSFTVKADVFATDALNPNGASRITARLIRDFGRPTQREEVTEIELLPPRDGAEPDEDVVLLGRIRVMR